MFYSTLLVAASALVGLVSAQNNTSFNPSGPYTINPDSVPLVNRTSACNAQHGNCPLICGGLGQTSNNTCDATTLTYSCTCTNSSPNISSYTNTIPSFECIQWVQQCVAAAGNDLNELTNCRSVVCGMKDPGDVTQQSSSSSSASASMSATAAASSSSGGSPSASQTSSSSSKGAAAAMTAAANYGTPMLAAGMIGLFGLAL